jgi:hypothetical protein
VCFLFQAIANLFVVDLEADDGRGVFRRRVSASDLARRDSLPSDPPVRASFSEGVRESFDKVRVVVKKKGAGFKARCSKLFQRRT